VISVATKNEVTIKQARLGSFDPDPSDLASTGHSRVVTRDSSGGQRAFANQRNRPVYIWLATGDPFPRLDCLYSCKGPASFELSTKLHRVFACSESVQRNTGEANP